MSSFKSRLPAIIACVYLLPGIWIIVSSYSCGAMMCDLVAIVYSALPVPFIKAFYIMGASIQGCELVGTPVALARRTTGGPFADL
jgi:hypothetical protein